MANWWDWSGASADSEEAIRQSKAAQVLARAAADYDRSVQQARDDEARFYERNPVGGTAWDPPQPRFYRSLPPEARMAAMWEAGMLTPKNPSPGYSRFLSEVVNYPLELGARPRDTLIRAGQELSEGNYGSAAGHALAAPFSTFVPAVAAGRYGDEDDWRENARSLGVSERDVMLLDIGTDPTTYMGFGMVRALPRVAGRADDVLRALRRYGGELRYGSGVPTYLEDAMGNTLMRTRNSPGGVLGRLALPAP